MVTRKTILELVRAWAKSPEGKAEIKRVCGVEYDEKFTMNTVKKYARMMKDILYKHIHELIDSFKPEDIIIDEAITNEEGRIYVGIRFDEDALKRNSLRPDLYPEGLNNIVLLFARGYSTSHPLKGIWERPGGDIEVWAKRSRQPNDYLYDAISEFNEAAKGIAFAMLKNEYQ